LQTLTLGDDETADLAAGGQQTPGQVDVGHVTRHYQRSISVHILHNDHHREYNTLYIHTQTHPADTMKYVHCVPDK